MYAEIQTHRNGERPRGQAAAAAHTTATTDAAVLTLTVGPA